MLTEMIQILSDPVGHVCVWRDGEAYIEPAPVAPR